MNFKTKLLLLATLLPVGLAAPFGAARAQNNIDVARRRLLCAQMGYDLMNPLGQMMLQRCFQGGPLANIPHGTGHPVQLVHPVGPLVHSTGPLIAPPTQRAGDGCRQGYVWREAVQGDHVCVSPSVRQRSWNENRLAPDRVNQVDHAYGPDTCQGGYVWREAIPTDHVCVAPAIRDEARSDNAAASDRVAR
jgi:hypothetical protein